MNYEYEVLERDRCFQGFFRMDRVRLRHELFAGGWGTPVVREVMVREPVVVVLPYDPVLDRVVLLEQFRIGAVGAASSPWMLEVVAGIIEPGETPEEVARRELVEEAGCEALDLVPVYQYQSSPGGLAEHVSLFCARVDAGGVGGIHGVPGEGEDIRAFTVTRQEAMAALADGRINSASPIIVLQWLQANHEQLRKRWTAVET